MLLRIPKVDARPQTLAPILTDENGFGQLLGPQLGIREPGDTPVARSIGSIEFASSGVTQ